MDINLFLSTFAQIMGVVVALYAAYLTSRIRIIDEYVNKLENSSLYYSRKKKDFWIIFTNLNLKIDHLALSISTERLNATLERTIKKDKCYLLKKFSDEGFIEITKEKVLSGSNLIFEELENNSSEYVKIIKEEPEKIDENLENEMNFLKSYRKFINELSINITNQRTEFIFKLIELNEFILEYEFSLFELGQFKRRIKQYKISVFIIFFMFLLGILYPLSFIPVNSDKLFCDLNSYHICLFNIIFSFKGIFLIFISFFFFILLFYMYKHFNVDLDLYVSNTKKMMGDEVKYFSIEKHNVNDVLEYLSK